MEQKIQGNPEDKKYDERMVRILSEDIEGRMKIYPSLTRIRGVSWAVANAACKELKLDKNRKIGSLSQDEIKEIQNFLKNPSIPVFILNRRHDFETGEDKHLVSTDLELRTEFDIKRLKKIKSYKGIRHGANLPVRGQRTRSHFRKNKSKGVGIKKKKKQP